MNEQSMNSYSKKQFIKSLSFLSLTTLITAQAAAAININAALSSFGNATTITTTTTATPATKTLNDYLASKKSDENVNPMTHGVNK